MQTVILCGGRGTRLSEKTGLIPKPMVEVGDYPILWHIMNIYAHYKHSDFTLALGYKANIIKDYFLHFRELNSDFSINLKSGKSQYLKNPERDWNVSLIDTGEDSMTGGRLLRLKDRLKSTFMLTYGDGLSNVNIEELVKFHQSHGKLATITVVRPPSRFGLMEFEGDQITLFKEKPQTADGWINGGFCIFEPGIFDYLSGDSTVLEREPFENLATDGQLMAFRHNDFWQCMDTMRDKNYLNDLWDKKKAPWINHDLT
ncbi:MAG: glucose-1-phosphate cytidylyltransferase [Planctomycetes bacterium]|nr:glucose-1-phosphate cytidylyltransferase [Planctomycetota bacterium]